MKKRLAIFLIVGCLAVSTTACEEKESTILENNETAVEDNEENVDEGLLPFDFLGEKYINDFTILATPLSLKVDYPDNQKDSKTPAFFVESEGERTQITLLLSEDRHVLNINVSGTKNKNFEDIAQTAILAANPDIDFDTLNRELMLEKNPKSIEDMRLITSDGLSLIYDSSMLSIQKDAETQNEHSTENPTPQITDSEIEVSDILTCPEFTATQNTSEMVDQIASVAKENAPSMTDDQASEIVNIIRDSGHKFYNGPKEMEKFMWYGYLLDYKYDDTDPRSELGMDLCQAIKYVYRNVETALDDSTKENLMQIDKDLKAIK